MPVASLNLVVLRSANLALSVDFYSCLGLEFVEHQHDSGPVHFSAELNGCVFELYPAPADGSSTVATRIGFSVPSIAATIHALSAFPDCVLSPPKASPWGLRAVITDPDGHRVELIED